MESWLADLIPDRGIIYWLYVANYLLALAFAVSEIFRSRTSQGSIAWILSLLILPFPMTLVYAIFGLKLFDDYAAVQTHSGRVLRKVRAAKTKILDQPATDEWPVLANVSQLPFLGGNEVELLVDGEATFDSIFAGISRAQSTLLIQFYIIHDDELGREFATRLIERANAGVKIYLLYDDVGCFWLPRAYKQRLHDAGINIRGFNHRHRFLRFLGPTRIQYRNHRKIVVVDGKEAWIGGLNVGDEYMGRSKVFGHWRDTHMRLRGPSVLAAELSFREDWQWATGEELTGLPTSTEIAGDESVLIMPTGPADVLESCAIAFDDVIGQTQKRLWIVSPYFVPDVSMETALFAAKMRGVDVRILVPQKPDHRIVWLASIAYANRMVHHGIDVYRYPNGFLHQKVILVDDKLAGVGTVNFDNRSFRINFEITMWFTHERTITAVEKMLKKDFAEANKVDLDRRGSQTVMMRFLTQAARLFSPIL
ncbi:MAG: cardiolipin synthase [Devosia nanyangense]|uniref:Cardiolipin synthase n=1 Tax=Devosia nanyangense TaxID=1228055 RepID=A0A933NZW0_9HYPH|nr:cardiolipin synthase [Devosia nanyangense]